MQYTREDLVSNSEKYRDNIKKLMRARIGSKQHDLFAARETRLNKKGVVIRKALGIEMKDPCVIGYSGGCESCTGYYVRSKLKLGKKNFMCEESEPGRDKCEIKWVKL